MIGRVCIVTGGGQGIGRALCLHFAAKGIHIVVADQNGAAGQDVAAEIARAGGGQAIAVETDVGDATSVAAMAKRAAERFGRIDILINNARWSGLAPTLVQDITDEDWSRALNVNVTGAFNCVRAVVPTMIEAQWGRIINLSSATVRQPPARPYLHYITSKAALIGMTRGLAKELGPHGITVNAILPGSVETGVTRPNAVTSAERERRLKASQAIPRVLTPADMVGAAYFLASADSALITGQSLAVDGGLTFG